MDILKTLSDWIISGIKSIVDLLPDSPFIFEVPSAIKQLLGYLNYFVPIKQMLITLAAWGACIALWYAASLFMRWLKAIE